MGDALKSGKVKFYNREKGYGFISAIEQGGRDVYLHSSELKKSQFEGDPEEGDILLFEVRDKKDKGPRAFNISRG